MARERARGGGEGEDRRGGARCGPIHVGAGRRLAQVRGKSERAWGSEEERRYGLRLFMWRCRRIYWRLRWAFSHRAWNKIIYALHGNMESDVSMESGTVTTWFWNARGAPVDVRHPKWEWIFEQATLWNACVVAVVEVEGQHQEFVALRKHAARLGYDVRWMVGEGGEALADSDDLSSRANGTVVMVARE